MDVWGGLARFDDGKPHVCHIKTIVQEKSTFFWLWGGDYRVVFILLLSKSKLLCSRETGVKRNFLEMMPFTHGSVLVAARNLKVWFGEMAQKFC